MLFGCGVVGFECIVKGLYLFFQFKYVLKINCMVLSIYFGFDEFEIVYVEMILGGYYDEVKVDGELMILNMVDFYSFIVLGQMNFVNVMVVDVVIDGCEIVLGMYGELGVGVFVFMDIGVVSWYFFEIIVNVVYEGFGGFFDGDFNFVLFY